MNKFHVVYVCVFAYLITYEIRSVAIAIANTIIVGFVDLYVSGLFLKSLCCLPGTTQSNFVDRKTD